MAYTAKTWVDNSAPSVCAANLNDLETGVADAHTTADRAVGKGVLQAKGDLFGALSASSPTRVVVGADDTVLVADAAQTHGLKWVQIGNAQVLAAAAIAYSKLNLAGSIVNADVGAGAAIAYSKLALAGSIVNADIASSASISAPKIAGFPSDSAKFLRGDATWAAPAGGLLVLISDTTLGAAAASIDVQNIPATYVHLYLMLTGRSATADTSDRVYLRLNNDSAANYASQRLYGVGGTVGAEEHLAVTAARIGMLTAANSPANVPGSVIARLPGYVDTTFGKVCYSEGGYRASTATGATVVQQYLSFWTGTAAINRITLSLESAGNFIVGTRMTLYGLDV